LGDVSHVLKYAIKNNLGFQISPEIIGIKVNPELRENQEYKDLIDRVIEIKKASKGVLGVMPYLLGIRDFAQFRCHPLLMPVIRPDGGLYYPCLEKKLASVNILDAGSYEEALKKSQNIHGDIPRCNDCCHIFCHMGLSLLQRHPISALHENIGKEGSHGITQSS
jgi:hypothetical protein